MIGVIVLNQIPFFNTFQHKKRGQLVEVNLAGIPLRSVNFYFTDVSEPSHIIFTRSVFILPTSQNRHSSSFSEGKKEVLLSLILYVKEIFLSRGIKQN
ncbi:hypothetical protein B5G00_03665 [Blautia sp. An46]|nr:hypothetical protein B5G33_14015 [Blautia sp. An81]OUN93971.1 hypothetical protein B5G00_03665 [Blautia sp. An46]